MKEWYFRFQQLVKRYGTGKIILLLLEKDQTEVNQAIQVMNQELPKLNQFFPSTKRPGFNHVRALERRMKQPILNHECQLYYSRYGPITNPMVMNILGFPRQSLETIRRIEMFQVRINSDLRPNKEKTMFQGEWGKIIAVLMIINGKDYRTHIADVFALKTFLVEYLKKLGSAVGSKNFATISTEMLSMRKGGRI